MDPVTAIGVLSSVISIADVVGSSIKKLTKLQSAYRDIPFVSTVLVGQLHIIQTALDGLASTWDSRDFKSSPRYRHLATQVGAALKCFAPLINVLQESLEDVDVDRNVVTVKSKLSFLWNEKEVDRYFVLVDRQVNALNLLLQAIQCNTWAEQQRFIDDGRSQNTLRLAQDCNSSIFGMLSDCESFTTEDTDGISAVFEFDQVLSGSGPYLSAQRSHLRQAIRSERRPQDGTVESISSHGFQDRDIEEADCLTIRPNHAVAAESSDLQSVDINDSIDVKFPPAQAKTVTIKEILEMLDDISLLLAQSLPPTLTDINLDQLDLRSVEPRWRPFRRRVGQRVLANERNIRIGAAEKSAHLHAQPSVQTVLLGTSGSGKSTLFKGLKHLMGKTPTLDDRLNLRWVVFTHAVQSARAVLMVMEDWRISLETKENEVHAQVIQMQPCEMDGECLSAEVVTAVKALWMDDGFRLGHKLLRVCGCYENFEYFVYSIERLANAEYVPNFMDILLSRLRTSGMHENTSSPHDFTQRLCDISGVRSERSKWWYRYDRWEDFGLVMFTVDACGYDKVLLEDPSTNAMKEQLWLFDVVVNSERFRETVFLLVFSRMDVLEQHLSTCHPSDFFLDFKPSKDERIPTADEYMTYLESRFLGLIKTPAKRDSVRVVRASLVEIGDDEVTLAVEMS